MSKSHQSLLTTQVSNLLDRMFKASPIKDALIDGAAEFFANQPLVNKINEELDEKNKHSSGEQKQAAIETDRTNFQQQLRSERVERNERLTNICYEILELSEGENFEETNRKSAQLLGTIQLLSHTEGNPLQIAKINEQHKPLYKAVLSLRLLDQLILDGAIKDSYIQHFIGDITPEQYKEYKELNEVGYEVFVSEVKIAIIKAALIQDIGNYHPDAQLILVGANEDKDPFRTLEVDERKELLQINYRETLKYLVEGIGVGDYMGNSKKDRDLFQKQETRKLKFIKELLKGAINPKQGLANVLKVPQIYCSIVLSIKPSYKYKLIPKVYQALYQNAERGACSEKVVDCLYKITGMFPQGFGVTYLALDAAGNSLERYEYAVVNHLYPKNPEEPVCRIATRQLSFIGYGADMVVKKSENLYFAESAKRLASMSKARLQEILEKLVSNYQERAELDLIPRCWHPRDFFSEKDNQKLWNKS
ncbi:hypothetical protein HII17_02850 [Thalassotalea sp. M1531]|uniref:Uncharacterized protein n=1 Tax=Thalassotalea algicola TaxID=2716224 RepID=A0A7Y0L9U4_9GAMM|nr:hypothetical protein [Thalassotalea algicola]NMP30491.1 hypothetical protein [Thalassotalea algicola]